MATPPTATSSPSTVDITSASQWAQAVLSAGGYPVTASNEQALIRWSGYEAGGWGTQVNTTTELNPLSTSLPVGGSTGFNSSNIQSYTSWADSIQATVAMFKQSNMASVHQSFMGGDALHTLPAALASAQWAGTSPAANQAYSKTIAGVLGRPAPAGTTTPTGGAAGDGVTAGPTQLTPPLPNVNPTNFHGYDLSAIPPSFLGEAEQAIQKYIADPALQAKVIGQDSPYGYTNWSLKIPQLNAVMITYALAPNGLWDKNTFQGIIANTQWWKTTDQNQRAWQQAVGSDPATAHTALRQAQDKVLATANQLGVTLSASQLDKISNTYAAQSFTPTGVLGSQSGTSQEWLDQAVVQAVTTVQKTGSLTGQSTLEATNPQNAFGITSQLYNQFQQIAQQYLMYNPNGKGLLSNQQLMDYVNNAVKNWTGSNSFGSSNLINGAVQSFTQQMMDQSKQMYPSLAKSIDAGTTPANYVAPIQSLIGQQLGLDPQSVNLTDPTWSWTIATPDPKTGVKTALTQDQILQKITSPNFKFQGPNGQMMSFDNTNNAIQNANQVGQSMKSAFGFGG